MGGNIGLYIGKNILKLDGQNVLHTGNTSASTSTVSGATTIKSIKINNTNYNIYDSGNTDTKVNVTLGTTTKAFLLGTSTTPTSTAQAVTSIADTGVYLTTTSGELRATKYNVADGCTLQYNTTTKSLDFVFA